MTIIRFADDIDYSTYSLEDLESLRVQSRRRLVKLQAELSDEKIQLLRIEAAIANKVNQSKLAEKDTKKNRIITLYRQGVSVAYISARLGVSLPYVNKVSSLYRKANNLQKHSKRARTVQTVMGWHSAKIPVNVIARDLKLTEGISSR